MTPDTDYYFVIFTNDPEGCGDYTYTTTGNYLGCTDESANNYDMQATIDDGTCDYDGVVPANDTCGDAIVLECNSSNIGSTGGATAVDAPLDIANCIALPGAGVWYSFVGDSSLHTLSTCGSVIDSQVNLLAADTVCGQFTCVEGATLSDGNGICSFFDQDDVNMEFISIPGQQYYVYVSSEERLEHSIWISLMKPWLKVAQTPRLATTSQKPTLTMIHAISSAACAIPKPEPP